MTKVIVPAPRAVRPLFTIDTLYSIASFSSGGLPANMADLIDRCRARLIGGLRFLLVELLVFLSVQFFNPFHAAPFQAKS